jgi:hypothetical protein
MFTQELNKNLGFWFLIEGEQKRARPMKLTAICLNTWEKYKGSSEGWGGGRR